MDPRFPIGQFEPQPYTEKQFQEWLNDIRYLPRLLENAVLNLNEEHLQVPYREGGWTSNQVVHHVADSHMNALIRFKLALTEEQPTIKPYDEAAWAKLPDVEALPVNISLTLLHALHSRWYHLIKGLDETTLLNRSVIHPQHGKIMSCWHLLGMYSWHGRHHVAHITRLRDRMGW
ncbi:YfiT family bacillithiol transferase [Flavihumibacter sp. CACIAM 22H1]|uniref:YfiT family bacillithiol transferase n=1 Tax=Flavihumibacter sp. CACIAM 22H1 TaxID=1812911 RepID=UPI0007A89027|nr:putative metal-dependent hydrolase [Flavihumibacter sp. CACIAM 22H1]KYP14948.1 MAG: metal-dependent hydrolase [Flavihumibacter sp. CACIAM 22H1]